MPSVGGSTLPPAVSSVDVAANPVQDGSSGTYSKIGQSICTLPSGYVTNACAGLLSSMYFIVGTAANVTSLSFRLCDSAGSTLDTYSITVPTLTNTLLRADILITVPFSDTSTTKVPWAWIKIGDVTSTGDTWSADEYTKLATGAAFTWPTDGILYLHVTVAGTTYTVIVKDFIPFVEKLVYQTA